MDYKLFLRVLDKTRAYKENQFLEVEIPYNGTIGLIHIKNAEVLLKDDSFMSKGVLSFGRSGQLIIGQGYDKAEQVTEALQHITDTLRAYGRIKPLSLTNPVEYARVVPQWDDRPWDEIKNITPVCDSALLQAIGTPRFNCHCIGLKIVDGEVNIVFGERADGSHAGEFDNIAAGKMDSELSRDANMGKEIFEETEIPVAINDGKKDSPTYLGTIYTLRQKDSSIFNRHISVYVWSLNDTNTPQPNAEVAKFHTIPLDEFVDNIRAPSAAERKFPYFVPLDVFYAAAKYLKAQHDNGALDADGPMALNMQSIRLLNLIIDESETMPPMAGTAHADAEFMNGVGARLRKISHRHFRR